MDLRSLEMDLNTETHTQSFPQWSLPLEVQLPALEHPEENWPMILMCLTDGNVFTTLQKVIEVKAKASYKDLKGVLEERFSGDDYKRTLEIKLRRLQYRKNVNITISSTNLEIL